MRQKFTGYERDNETGLDFAEARYHANIQGRFTSVDPIFLAPHRLSDPQSLNLYSYVRNNPLTLVDPTGMDWYSNSENVYHWFDDNPGEGWTRAADGHQITNVQGATGDYARFNGHNVTLYNDSRRIVSDGLYRPPAPGGINVFRDSELGWTTVKLIAFPWMIGAAIGSGGLGAGAAVATTIYEEEFQGPLLLGETGYSGEYLKRLGTDPESTGRLARKAAEAEAAIGIHGVSVTAGEEGHPHSSAARSAVEEHFKVHNTPTRNDPLHRTVELPKPVTPQAAKTFNRIFGRIRVR